MRQAGRGLPVLSRLRARWGRTGAPLQALVLFAVVFTLLLVAGEDSLRQQVLLRADTTGPLGYYYALSLPTPTPHPVTGWVRERRPGYVALRSGGFVPPPAYRGVRRALTVDGVRGGTVVSDDGSLTLRVPRGAVRGRVRFSVQRRAVPTWASVPEAFFWAELKAESEDGQHQLHDFRVPLTLSVRVSPGVLRRLQREQGLLPEHLGWWQYDEEDQVWRRQPAGYDPATGLLHVRLEHFSEGAAGADDDATPSAPPSMQAYGAVRRPELLRRHRGHHPTHPLADADGASGLDGIWLAVGLGGDRAQREQWGLLAPAHRPVERAAPEQGRSDQQRRHGRRPLLHRPGAVPAHRALVAPGGRGCGDTRLADLDRWRPLWGLVSALGHPR